MTLSAGVDSATASEAGSFAGINSPAARCKRRVQLSHSPSVHCGLRQSNSQRASSSGTQPTNCSRTQSQMFRRRFMEPPRLAALSFTRTFSNLSWSTMLQRCSDAEDEPPICFLLKNVGDGAPRDLMAHVGPRSLYSPAAPITVIGGHPFAHEGHPPSARYHIRFLEKP